MTRSTDLGSARRAASLASPPLNPLKSRFSEYRSAFGALVALSAAGAFFWTQAAASEKKEEKKEKKHGPQQMDPEQFQPYELLSKTQVSPNTAVYRFKLPIPDQPLPMPVASFILAQTTGIEEKPTVRPYTPITYDEKGYFELMVKSYPDGKLSKHIGHLKVGDKLTVKGPKPKLEYKPNMKKTIAMIAGGTGVTPMLQVAHEILKNPNDKTEVRLIFANVNQDDILLKERIDGWAKQHKNFKVLYTLDNPPADWKGEKGFVSEQMVKTFVPPPSDDVLVFVCGPPGMMKAVSGPKTPDYEQGELSGVLKSVGFTEKNVYKF